MKPPAQFCARVGCLNAASYAHPLCHEHWKEWDAFEILECTRCRWFISPSIDEAYLWSVVFEDVEELGPGPVCDACVPTLLEQLKLPKELLPRQSITSEEYGEVPVIISRADISHTVRYIYILKLDRGKLYVGQTINLPVRMREHKDHLVTSTKGQSPRLVYFEIFTGDRSEVDRREDQLTVLNTTPVGQRRLRELIEDFQAPLRLVTLEA